MNNSWSDMTLKDRVDYLLNQLQISNDKIAKLEERVKELRIDFMTDDINKKAVGLCIKSIRQEKGMTLEEFGKLFGAGKGLVSRWENGLSLPNAERLKSIAKIGDISVNQLLNGEYDQSRYNFNFH